MSRSFDLLTSYAASGVRFSAAVYVRKPGRRPEQPLDLYEFEGCPFCRKAREALCVLDLDARIFPCPKGGTRFRPAVRDKGGREQFPYLVDPNTGASMYESMDIARYLATTYGDGTLPLSLSLGPVTTVSSGLASACRSGHGSRVRPSRAPAQPLELYSFEGSPYCRLAREALSELELPYLLHNVAKRSPRRAAFVERSGKMQVPYLVDPNTGTSLFESAEIVRYLAATYAL